MGRDSYRLPGGAGEKEVSCSLTDEGDVNLRREHTNRAFCKHWATSEGRALETWRFRGSAEAS